MPKIDCNSTGCSSQVVCTHTYAIGEKSFACSPGQYFLGVPFSFLLLTHIRKLMTKSVHLTNFPHPSIAPKGKRAPSLPQSRSLPTPPARSLRGPETEHDICIYLMKFKANDPILWSCYQLILSRLSTGDGTCGLMVASSRLLSKRLRRLYRAGLKGFGQVS